MKKNRFLFNQKTLTYEYEDVSFFRSILKTIIPKLISSIILGLLFFYVLTSFIYLPDNLYFADNNNELKLEYKLLNKDLDAVVKELEILQKRDDEVYRMIFQTDVVPASKRKAGYGGSDRYSSFNKYKNSDLLINTSKKTDIISHVMLVQSESYDELFNYAKNIEKMAACIPAIQPIALDDLTRFGSSFGRRFHPILHKWKMHTGVDLTAPRGTPLHASGDGVVIEARRSTGGYGNIVKISHGFGFTTYYAHQSKILVKVGQKVKRGDVIGLVGSTGLSQAPHLHYEVRINNKPVNPVNYYYEDLTDEEYNEMIKASATAETHIYE